MQTTPTHIKRHVLKRGLVGLGWSLLTVLLLCAPVVAWVASVLDWSESADFTRTQATDLPYLASAGAPMQGKVLADATVQALGETPCARQLNGDEITVTLLGVYQRRCFAAAGPASIQHSFVNGADAAMAVGQ